jgi:hypothetical protein
LPMNLAPIYNEQLKELTISKKNVLKNGHNNLSIKK